MSSRRRALGSRGELLARRHLEASGYAILETNYRTRVGEIDLIAKKDGVLAFVEVKARRSGKFGSPQESITAGKRARLVAVAQEYLQNLGMKDVEWRIDVVALELNSRGRLVRLDIVENAIEL